MTKDERIAKLKEYARHKEDCPARQRFRIRDCPHCGSQRSHQQSGGYAFDAYRVCEDCDGPAYIPKERFGECTCGLTQLLKDLHGILKAQKFRLE